MNKKYEIEMTLEFLVDALNMNREIEFRLDGRLYFAEPETDPPLPRRYGIWDVETHTCIFAGGIDELLDFLFPSGKLLRKDFDRFEFLYIY